MRNIGVIFLSKKLTSKSGNEYYSGKLEGAEEFNLMGFLKESASGTKYMSLVATDEEENKSKAESGEAAVKPKPVKQGNLLDNTETIIDPDDLPF